MNNLNESINYQFKKYISETLNETFCKTQEFNKEKKYKYIFAINYFISRPELSKYWNDYFKWSISFLYESYYSFSLGQKNGGFLLLRSSIENFVKYVVTKIGKANSIDERAFKPNNRILILYSWREKQLELEKKANALQANYNEFSKLSHSAINSDSSAVSFFSEINKEFNLNYNYGMAAFKKIVKIYIFFIVYICKDSLKYWETIDLDETFSIILTNGEYNKIYNFIKK